MILHLDASALVKHYVAEPGSPEMSQAISKAEAVGTAVISRAERSAALAKAVRAGALTQKNALATLRVFRNEWPDLMRAQITELLIARADTLAWEHGLRGFDAVYLTAASVWQDAMGERVTMATFDWRLWASAERVGLAPYPANLPSLLDTWKAAERPSPSIEQAFEQRQMEPYRQFHHGECSLGYLAEQLGISPWEAMHLLEERGLRVTNP